MTSHAPAADGAHGHDEHVHPPAYYIKIWGILLALLAVSIIGPMFEIPVLTLMTAFGIAVVKAWLVCSKFMHLNIEKKFVVYFLVVALALLAIFYFGVAPDVMKHEGTQWRNVGAQQEVARGLEAAKTDPHHKHDAAKAEH